MNNQKPGILSDREIRLLCEVPVAEIQLRDMRVRGVSDRVHIPVFASEMGDIPALAERIGPIYAGEGTYVEHVDIFQDAWVAREKAKLKPMIAPFEPLQCKHMYQPAKPEQIRLIKGMREAGAKECDITDALRADNPLVAGSMTRGDYIWVLEKCVSYGLTSYGYDVRCGSEFKIFTNINSTVVDPKNFNEKNFVKHVGEFCIIPPNSFVLASTMEYFDLPRNVVADCVGKSTYARCGLSIMVTPLEPEWEGYLTLEFANTTPLPAKIYAGEGCGQIRFFRGAEPCETSYRDRGGKYMGQASGPVTPKV